MNFIAFIKATIFFLNICFISNLFAQEDHSSHHSMSKSVSNNEEFSKSIIGLPFIKKAQVIKLKDGESFTLIASIAKQKIGNQTIRRYAYNGTIPGPIFEIPKGAKVNIKFINQTDSDQTLHSHGLRTDYRYDGAVGLGQKAPVKPGETFVYKLSFPDVGVFWYHPHVREDYSQDMGLYGNYIVKKASYEKNFESVNQQIPIILDDILLEKGTQPFYKNSANYAAMGRYGNIMLINGSENYNLQVNEGDVTRFYLTNSANTRTFNIKIPGAKMKLIAADMSHFEKETWVDNIIIAPSERYTIDILFKNKGNYFIENSIPGKSIHMGSIKVLNKKSKNSYEKEFFELNTNNEIKNELVSLRKYFDKAIDKKINISIDMTMNHAGHGDVPEIEWEDSMPMMNSVMTSKDLTWELIDPDTNKKNMDISWLFKKDNYYKIRIFNDPKSKHPMQHPIHFHGQRFLVLSDNGLKNTNLAWKDTVLVPGGHSIDILLEASNPGKWMAHCHIAEHLSSGMMMGFTVMD